MSESETKSAVEERVRIIQEVRRRASVDPEFRKLALADPAAAIAKISPKMPKDRTYRFVDNSGSMKTIPLPEPVPDTAELSDLELERVAGGTWSVSTGWTR